MAFYVIYSHGMNLLEDGLQLRQHEVEDSADRWNQRAQPCSFAQCLKYQNRQSFTTSGQWHGPNAHNVEASGYLLEQTNRMRCKWDQFFWKYQSTYYIWTWRRSVKVRPECPNLYAMYVAVRGRLDDNMTLFLGALHPVLVGRWSGLSSLENCCLPTED